MVSVVCVCVRETWIGRAKVSYHLKSLHEDHLLRYDALAIDDALCCLLYCLLHNMVK